MPYKFTAKEIDKKTGLYYYGARYLDPKYSKWISTDPALGEYIPKAPIDDDAKKYNQNLPGMGVAFNHINGNLYHYAANNPVRYLDPDGRENVSFVIYRSDNSKYSPYDKSFRGLDIIQFKNHKTGEIFNLYNVQTYVSHSDYPVGNTIDAFMGGFSIQYLGNNQKKGQKLFGGFQSKFKGPIFNVQNASTKDFGITDKYGQLTDSDDKTPIRIHSNYDLNKDKEVGMASGGCPMYEYEQCDAFASFLERSDVKPGDKIYGYIKECFEP